MTGAGAEAPPQQTHPVRRREGEVETATTTSDGAGKKGASGQTEQEPPPGHAGELGRWRQGACHLCSRRRSHGVGAPPPTPLPKRVLRCAGRDTAKAKRKPGARCRARCRKKTRERGRDAGAPCRDTLAESENVTDRLCGTIIGDEKQTQKARDLSLLSRVSPKSSTPRLLDDLTTATQPHKCNKKRIRLSSRDGASLFLLERFHPHSPQRPVFTRRPH
jgi:hypothetical protein